MIAVFYGADTFRSWEAFRSARMRAEQEAGVPVKILRDDLVSPASLAAAVNGQSLFGTPSPVAVERLTSWTGARGESVARVLRAVPSSQTLLVWEEQPVLSGVVWRTLTKLADRLQTFAPLGAEAARQWVVDRVSAAGGAIAEDACHLLVEACGANLWRLASEVDKLLLLVVPAAEVRGADGQLKRQQITRADVEEVVPMAFGEDFFATARAIVGGKAEQALRLLASFRRAGGDPRRLLSCVVRDLQRLVRVRGALDAGVHLGTWEVARMLHVSQEAAESMLLTVKRTRTAAARALLDRCTLAYYHLNTGRAQADEILDSLALASVTK